MAATPADRWKRMVAAHKRRCQQILASSGSVRYAGVINEYGRTLTGVASPSARLLLGPMDVKNEFFVISNVMTQREGHASKLGALEHAVLVHKKAHIVLVHSGKVTYYVSVRRHAPDLAEVISAVKRIARRG